MMKGTIGMTIEEVRAACIEKRIDTESDTLGSIFRIDEPFLFHVLKYYYHHSSEISPIEHLSNCMRSEDALDEAINGSRGEAWYNTYPFGTITDKVYSRFLGISLGKKMFNKVLKHAVKHNSNVVKYCEPSNFRDRTTVILTDYWDPEVFKKYEKDLLSHALISDIWTILILVTEYGFVPIPFLPNDRDALDGIVLDEDKVKADVQRWIDTPVEYIVDGGTWNLGHHEEYTIYLYDKAWELIDAGGERNIGKIRYEAINKFLDEVLWIAETDKFDLDAENRSFDCERYELYIFGKRLVWDSTNIGKNGDPRYIKLNKALKKLIKSFEPNVKQ